MENPIFYDFNSKIWKNLTPINENVKKINLGEIILKQLSEYNSEKIIEINIDSEIRTNASEMKNLTINFALNLQKLGIKKGDVVVFFSSMNPFTTPLIYACIIIGSIFVPLEILYTNDIIEHVFELVNPTVIVYDSVYHDKLTGIINNFEYKNLKYFLSFESRNNGNSVLQKLYEPENSIEDIENFRAPNLGDPQEVLSAFVLTSGTTGKPKLMAHSQTYLGQGATTYWNVDYTHRVYVASPMRWVSQISAILQPILQQCTRVYSTLPPSPQFCAEAIQKYEVTHFFSVATLMKQVLDYAINQRKDHIKSLQAILTGGERISTRILQNIASLNSNCIVIQCYGMTELAGCISNNIGTNMKGGSFILPGFELKITNEDGQSLDYNQNGLICVKTSTKFGSYWKSDEANRNSFSNGWLITGDYGKVDENNQLHIYNRFKDLIKLDGNYIIPSLIEAEMESHPLLDASYIVGIPHEDPKRGEIPIAFCKINKINLQESKLNLDQAKQDIISYLDTHLPKDQIPPTEIFFRDEYPYTSCGKVDKISLRNCAMEKLKIQTYKSTQFNPQRIFLFLKIQSFTIMFSNSSISTLTDEFNLILDDNILWDKNYQPLINEDISLGQLLLHMLKHDSEKILQVCYDTETQFTGHDLRIMSIRVAQNFMRYGIKQEDVIGFIASNTKYLAPIIFGIIYCGGQLNSLDPSFDKHEIIHMYRITKPKFIFCDKNIYNLVKEAINELNLTCQIFVMDGEIDGVTSAEIFLKPTGNEDHFVPSRLNLGSDQTFAIICSSGTTGLSKGVCVSHRSMIHNIMSFNDSFTPFNVYTCFSTIYWISGLWSLLLCAIRGFKRIITHQQFNPKLILEIIEKYKVNFLLTPPSQIALTVESEEIKTFDLTSVRAWFVSGSALPLNVANKMKDYLANGKILNGYGITEVGNIICRETYSENRTGSVGKVIPYIMLKIVDEDGNILSPNQNGEILAHNRCRWFGYYNNVTETTEVYTEDGWIRTGDVGYFDDDGFIFLTGRKKEIMKYKNFHFYPNEIENIIHQIPDVLEVCVCGIPDVIATDLPAAAIIKRCESNLTEDDIYKYVEKNMVHFKHLRGGVYFLEKFPKASSGKILRKKVKLILEELYKVKNKTTI
ncbi:mycosubtilin synthase subunit C-like [Condylostylus longicornis]|uniref:mycosubtilin synthase subunit C-like n=1 Tax=Condylostylus longicornis TaxID=2530218 RepID=UPI00244DF865|nr:mycosubtilin synthase subunit C-like [Condylostylus longicornis]